MKDEIEESVEDRRHPRRRFTLTGHQNSETRLLDAYRSGKMHHGWIFGGPSGIGKATLAYRFARFILCYPDPTAIPLSITTLDVDPDHRVARRVAANGHSDLLTITRSWDPKTKKIKREIGAIEARKASGFFTRTAGEGGWRICIVDPAGAMNATAANALLKTLEEPPERALFILVADVPGKLMPTIRSRCLRLDMVPLGDEDVAAVLNQVIEPEEKFSQGQIETATSWAKGSPGRALAMLTAGAHERLIEFARLTDSFPALDYNKALRFAEKISARGSDQHYLMFCDLLMSWLADEAHKWALKDDVVAQQTASALASAYGEIGRSLRRANGLNLDKRQTILQALYRVDEAWSGQSAA